MNIYKQAVLDTIETALRHGKLIDKVGDLRVQDAKVNQVGGTPGVLLYRVQAKTRDIPYYFEIKVAEKQ